LSFQVGRPSMTKSTVRVFLHLGFVLLAFLAARAADPAATPFYFTTLAGQASRGSNDGTGTDARFCEPIGVAVDATGNVYVADSWNHVIRRISPSGVVTTIAGSAGKPGYVDGVGSASRFKFPEAVAVDRLGNLFVADRDNHAIRKIAADGTVTTLAGSPTQAGSVDGTAGAARFNSPAALALNGAGELFVADQLDHVIRKISLAGEVSTFAGSAGVSGFADGTGTAARFNVPQGLAFDAAGNLYVADAANVTIRRITPAGVVTTVAGTPGAVGSADGLGAAARFLLPRSVAVDGNGNVLVADLFNGTVRTLTPAGMVTTLAGQPPTTEITSVDGTGSAARFGYLTGIATDAASNAYVVDQWHNTVRKVTPAGVVTTLAGNAASIGSTDGTGPAARFSRPTGVAVDGSGNIFVTDRLNSTVRRITASGVVTTLAGSPGKIGSVDGTGAAARLDAPLGITADSLGNVYVSEPTQHTIRKITAAGVVTTFAGTAGSYGDADGSGANARFSTPYGLAIDNSNQVLVADRNNSRIRRITADGAVTTVAGQSPGGHADGPAATAKFLTPEGVAVDRTGNIYVADTGNSVIRKITPAGTVSTLAGEPGTRGSVDGTGRAARFNSPSSIVVDDSGNVFVADTENHTFRRVTPEGVVTTLAGSAENGQAFNDGLGDAVRFFHPTGVAMNRSGFAYVADELNNTIRQGQLAAAPVATEQPKNLTVATGASVTFSVVAAAVPAPTYQWYFNGQPFSGATSATLSFSNARPSDAGDYSVTITNALGSVASTKATLTVTDAPPPAPSSSGGGGGGAPSECFLLALFSCALARRAFPRH